MKIVAPAWCRSDLFRHQMAGAERVFAVFASFSSSFG
jgi:hypothetical protein